MRVVQSGENSGTIDDGQTVTLTLTIPAEADRVSISVDDGSDGAPANHDFRVETDGGGEVTGLVRERKTGQTTITNVNLDAFEGDLTVTVTDQSGGTGNTYRIQALAGSHVN